MSCFNFASPGYLRLTIEPMRAGGRLENTALVEETDAAGLRGRRQWVRPLVRDGACCGYITYLL